MIQQTSQLPPNTTASDYVQHEAGESPLDASARNISSFEESGVDPFDAPIPGESLTGDPENPKPWEKSPKFTNPDKAIHEIFLMLTEDGSYEQLLNSLREGVPIDILTQVYLYNGFEEGYWNPDLMLLLIEPTAYIIMWMADYNEINAVLDSDDPDWDPDKEDEEDEALRTQAKQDIQKMNPKYNKNVPPSLLAQMDEFQQKAGDIK